MILIEHPGILHPDLFMKIVQYCWFLMKFFHWIYIHYRALEPVPLQIAMYVKGVNVAVKQHSCQ